MRTAKYDLQERFIDYAVRVIKLAEALPNKKTGIHIRGQIERSGTSPAANYAEACAAESNNDFVHKLKIVLKELRECTVWLKIILKSGLMPSEKIMDILHETDELISIVYKSIQTINIKRANNQ